MGPKRGKANQKTEMFCLKWTKYTTKLGSSLIKMMNDDCFADVTLACDGTSTKAHKLILSACSNYFKSLFKSNPCQHPIVFMRDVKYSDLKAILTFMYKGEVNVSQPEMGSLMKTAELLKVKGLTDQPDDDENDDDSLKTARAGSARKAKRKRKKDTKEESHTVSADDTINESDPDYDKRKVARMQSSATSKPLNDTRADTRTDVAADGRTDLLQYRDHHSSGHHQYSQHQLNETLQIAMQHMGPASNPNQSQTNYDMVGGSGLMHADEQNTPFNDIRPVVTLTEGRPEENVFIPQMGTSNELDAHEFAPVSVIRAGDTSHLGREPGSSKSLLDLETHPNTGHGEQVKQRYSIPLQIKYDIVKDVEQGAKYSDITKKYNLRGKTNIYSIMRRKDSIKKAMEFEKFQKQPDKRRLRGLRKLVGEEMAGEANDETDPDGDEEVDADPDGDQDVEGVNTPENNDDDNDDVENAVAQLMSRAKGVSYERRVEYV